MRDLYATKSNLYWRKAWGDEENTFWDWVIEMANEEGQVPSIVAIRRTWAKEGLDPDLLPTDNTIKRTILKEMKG